MALNTSSVRVLLLLVVNAASLQQSGKDALNEQWNPLDMIRSDPQPEDASTDSTAAFHEEISDAKSAVKRASKHTHNLKGKSNGEMTRWELEDDSFEQASEYCEESCTSANLRVTTWESKCETTNCQGCDPCKELQRNSASKYILDLPPLGDRVPPRMLVAAGCDGSSAVLKHAHAILEMHGIRTAGRAEDAVNRTLVQMHEDLKSNKQTLLFRGTIGTDRETILSKDLLDLGTLVAQVSRRNSIDQVVCMVKDCFGTDMGHPVLRGEESDMCVKRRQVKEPWMKGQYKAFLDVSTLIANMKNLDDKLNQTATDLRNLGYTPEFLKTEDLLDFEWSEEMMWSAVPSWTRLLKSWGIEPDKHALAAYLRENMGTREPPLSQGDTIFNFASVKEIMNGTRYSWMIRE